MNVDLNIENYELDDLLNLFNLSYNFGEQEIKRVKMVVMKTHPDKSGLENKYFLFFQKAYKMLLEMYYFRGKRKKSYNTEYKDLEYENVELIKSLDGKSVIEFNNWFNKMFESVKLSNEEMDSGYGDWLKNGEIKNTKNVKLSDFGVEFEKRKKECKDLVIRRDVENGVYNLGANLLNEKPDLYESNIFSKLKYEDLKKAHTETVVPVCMEDFDNMPKFNSMEEYVRYRDSKKTEPLDVKKSRKYLSERDDKVNESSMRRAYKLLKRDEEMERAQEKWWKNFKRLKS
jgi:hypothetical protein